MQNELKLHIKAPMRPWDPPNACFFFIQDKHHQKGLYNLITTRSSICSVPHGPYYPNDIFVQSVPLYIHQKIVLMDPKKTMDC